MPSFEFSGASLDDLAREMRESALRVRSEVDKTVWTIGAEVNEAAKGIVSPHSQSIPPTMHVEEMPGAAVLKSGGGTVALADLYNRGNAGKGGSKSDTFKHPVFGHWYSATPPQKRFPYYAPALKLMRRQITKRMEKAWDEALRPLIK
jgi:hypothetical protein